MTDISGFCAPGWEGVREAFADNFQQHGESGAATAVHHRGRLVVDLWGGTYRPDTLQLVFSTTKGWTAAMANLLVQRGELDLEAPVTTYWPEFGQAGKQDVPVRLLLTHQVGLPYPDEPATLDDVVGWDPIVAKLAASAPQWEPGTAHGYHAVTYGFLVGEVIKRITGVSPGTFFAREFAEPLGLDAWIGLPEEQEPRVEPLIGGISPADAAADMPEAMRQMLEQFMGPESPLGKALSCNGALAEPGLFNERVLHAAEVPAANGICDARSLSRFYAALVGDLPADERFPAATQILTDERIRDAATCRTSGADRILMFDTTIGLGFWTSSPFAPYGTERAFGHNGAGGSVGFAEPEHEIGFGYVMSRMQQNLSGDPRTRGLIKAVYDAIGVDAVHV